MILSARMQILCQWSISGLSFPLIELRRDVRTGIEENGRGPYAIFSSKSLGIDISSTLSTRFDADSSSRERLVVFLHPSNEDSVRKAARMPSSLMIG
jgi:hypothetical protein